MWSPRTWSHPAKHRPAHRSDLSRTVTVELAPRSAHRRRGVGAPCRVALVAGLTGLVWLAAACAEPDPIDPEPETSVVEDPIEEPDEREALLDELDVLHQVLQRIEDTLIDVQEAESLESAHRAAEQALAHLLVNGETDGSDDEDALLPSETIERTQSVSAPDLLSATMAQAQDTGGRLGRDVADVLRDPIAGDLGAWQRDAAGMVALAENVAGSSTELEALEPAILELEGEGTRALAWTFAARDADDLEFAHAAAERALAHVQVMRLAIEDVGSSS
jgi:hypothetical protein